MKIKKGIYYFKSLLVFILLFNGLTGKSQTTHITIKWLKNAAITEKPGVDIGHSQYLMFEDARYNLNEYLPIFTNSTKLKDYNQSKTYKVQNIEFETISDSILQNIDLPDTLPLIIPELKIYDAGSDFYLHLNMFTLRINSLSGKYERIVSFDVAEMVDSVKLRSLSGIVRTTSKSSQGSILAEGNWYKIKVNNSGIYKLTYSDIAGMGLVSPANLKIFGNGGKQLSYLNSDSRPEDLKQVPVYMNKGNDDIFNEGDYILFYAQGPVTWYLDSIPGAFRIFRQKVHPYSDAAYYFITTDIGNPLLIPTVDNRTLINNLDVNTFDDYSYYEKNEINLIASGRNWYSERFDNTPFDTTFIFSSIIPDKPVKIIASVAGRSAYNRYANLLVDDVKKASVKISSIFSLLDNEGNYAQDAFLNYQQTHADEKIKIGLTYDKQIEGESAYLDYVTINARRSLVGIDNILYFRDVESVGNQNTAQFSIENSNSNYHVWDITDINNVFEIQGELTGSTFRFKASSEQLHEYVTFDITSDYPKPIILDPEKGGKVKNQNLRGSQTYNYIIVTHPIFKDEADRLAEYHRNNSNLTVLVVTPDEIYNEFSSGAPDVCAIRDFFRHQYINGSNENILKYALLFGDGSYNNHMNIKGNTNFILTYQSANSLSHTKSYVTDDFFGLLGYNEGESEGNLDIGVGRITAGSNDGSSDEAKLIVDKILAYNTSKLNDWRSSVCFMSDDQADNRRDGPIFMDETEDLIDTINNYYQGFDFKKIYIDAYEQKTSSTGPVYPEAQKELINSINKGTLIWNYTGHGGPNGITAEKVFQSVDVSKLKNGVKLPIFITASCSVSQFDDINMENKSSFVKKQSCGELMLLNPDGGSVALFSTSRVVFAFNNFYLNTAVFRHLFEKDKYGKRPRLGDVIMKAKNDLRNDDNKLNFLLIGDPAIILQYPEYKVITDSINNQSVEAGPDTLKAFNKINVNGYVAFDDSTIISDFNGFVYPRVYDKPDTVRTLANDFDTRPYVYFDQRNIIYKGKVTVKNGRFNFSFIVPIDISYQEGKGKISYYAENETYDAQGEFTEIYIGGTGEKSASDNSGPEIELFMNDKKFKDGGITSKDPNLVAYLKDENGISTTGIGIGHDIVAVLDNDNINKYVLNDYYQSDVDDYRSGMVVFPFKDLEKGLHYLELKSWDIFNNSSESLISFTVDESDGMVIEKLINFPNPAFAYTTFQYSHNFPDEDHNVLLEVFDLSGRVVYRSERTVYETGFVSQPLNWDLRSLNGNDLQSGIYPYRLRVTTSAGSSFINQKLIIIR